MIWLNFGKWSFSKVHRFLGYYVMSTRYYYKGKWTPVIFMRFKTDDKITWAEIKEVCTSLDNLFGGSIIVAAIGLLYWFWMLMGIWLFITPVAYVALCYIGYYVKRYFQSRKGLTKVETDNASGSPL